jgi:hypothetical protein
VEKGGLAHIMTGGVRVVSMVCEWLGGFRISRLLGSSSTGVFCENKLGSLWILCVYSIL